jgi:UDP-2,3-diacylglucosamine pyrophosphatase LpxH
LPDGHTNFISPSTGSRIFISQRDLVRIAMVSDTHFGDELCVLVSDAHSHGPPALGPGYQALVRAIGHVDYLVLVGDILDFSIASYERTYCHAKVFFSALQRDGVADQLVYIPGNHDFDIWPTVEHQVNVINQLKQGELPRAFKQSVPAVIDDRCPNPIDKFRLPDVTPKLEWHDNRSKYGRLFMDHITRRPSKRHGVRAEGPLLTFNFAFPNLYLVSDKGESVLVTHGHYFEPYWALASDWLMEFAADLLPLQTFGEPNLQELVGMNLPLNQLACAGIGQAQPLTTLIRAIQREADFGRTDILTRCLDRFVAQVMAKRIGVSRARRAAERAVLEWMKRRVLRWLAASEPARYSRLFMTRPHIRERFRRYYRATAGEMRQLRLQHGIDLPPPTHVVFGHTHQPIPWGAGELVDVIEERPVHFCNLGGWLLRDDDPQSFVGAEVVLYESGRGLSSHSIRASDLVESSAVTPREAQLPLVI